ncbi:nucleotidyl cyclase domain-containing protein [Tautonia sociabilis]|uniref:GGDEF domain-containing protein n=1 Tax=Tautonia sociabilis TaxID=2080755 RepID=A0A432MN34_9BACT|nr:GGDEF domain-containing protein [Tautonia sociabilis]RUL88478.1 GGDEF domain-containing protein [Tautonia sociabilis]
MKASPPDATITTQVSDLPAMTRSGWSPARFWPAFRGPHRSLSRFLSRVGSASRREEVHELFLRTAMELTGARRVELRPVGGARRILVTPSGGAFAPGEGFTMPVRYRGEELGSLTVWTRTGRRPRPSQVESLESLCAIAAIVDRLLGREPMLKLSAPPSPSADGRPRAMLLPFLRQLILLSRRRREPLTVFALGLDRPIGTPGEILSRAVDGASDPVLGAILDSIRESDLVVQDDPRTLIVVLPNASAVNAPLIAESVLRAADEAAENDCREGPCIGVSCFPDDSREADVLIDVALEALRRARLSAEFRVVIANRSGSFPRIVPAESERLLC